MYIPQDNDMLYSMVNMKLRDQYDSLDELCDCEDVDPAMLIARLNGAGYEYDEAHNKFTPVLVAAEADADVLDKVSAADPAGTGSSTTTILSQQ